MYFSSMRYSECDIECTYSHTLFPTHCFMIFTHYSGSPYYAESPADISFEGYDLTHQSICVRLAWPSDEGYDTFLSFTVGQHIDA